MSLVYYEIKSDVEGENCDYYKPSGNEIDEEAGSIGGEPAP